MIDFHVHIGRLHDEYTEDFASQMMTPCNKNTENMEVDIGRLIQEMDRSNVQKAVLLGFNAKRTLGVHVTNEYVSNICKENPTRFIGFASFDGMDNTLCKGDLQKELVNYNLKGYKLAFGYLNMSPNDQGWYPIYEDAIERELPILVHMGYTPIKQANLRYCHPILLDKVLSNFPKLKIVIAHMGWPWIEDTLELLKRYENVYADLSIVSSYQSISTISNIIRLAKKHEVVNKLIWGTDYPMCSMIDSLNRFKEIKSHLDDNKIVIESGTWERIFQGNANYLLGIKEVAI
ncbi:hypothetical protein BAMA_04595 [Bacillus manliponensis]|uniref:Amidohydrolase-related domain-containing protein n=1 Tax=Bacillus manliponensis TaxID=574376 RepID=A0A073JWD3_9BACI|nr:amidohydrolase family protein [Bacillus manliponensis]KEK18551.1 hypothetical protein BAMA_04595 [Bacillus manliponensis]